MTGLIATGIILLSGAAMTQTPTMCTADYNPVCAEKQVQCITAPCDPVRSTYSNACMAAADKATVIFEGDCNIAEGGVIVGGDKDEHGCIGSAGYVRDEASQQCVRPWEQPDAIVAWAHDLGITKYNSVVDFNWDTLVTREQAAKMIMTAIDASGVPEWMIKQQAGSCVWTDTDLIDSSLLSMVTKSCTKGLFKGSNGKFMPKAYLTDTDLRTVTSRAAEFIPALMDILMRSRFAAPKDAPMTRGELITALHNLYQQIAPVVVVDPPALGVIIPLSGEYYLTSYNSTGVSNTGITMTFDDGVHAKFCNMLNGSYTANEDMINFGPMMSTMMYCDDTQLMSLESAFGSLGSVSYVMTDTGVTMTTSTDDTWVWKKK